MADIEEMQHIESDTGQRYRDIGFDAMAADEPRPGAKALRAERRDLRH